MNAPAGFLNLFGEFSFGLAGCICGNFPSFKHSKRGAFHTSRLVPLRRGAFCDLRLDEFNRSGSLMDDAVFRSRP